MQVVFAVAPQPLLEEFYSSFLSGDLPALAAHPSANFALQAFLAAANRSPLVKTLLAELKGSFKELLQRRRSGVVAALLAACARTSAGQADASKAIGAALTGLHDEGKVNNRAVSCAAIAYIGSSPTCTACLAASGNQSDCLFAELMVVHMAESSLAVNRIAESNQIIQVIPNHMPLAAHKGDQDLETPKKTCVSYRQKLPKNRCFCSGMESKQHYEHAGRTYCNLHASLILIVSLLQSLVICMTLICSVCLYAGLGRDTIDA